MLTYLSLICTIRGMDNWLLKVPFTSKIISSWILEKPATVTLPGGKTSLVPVNSEGLINCKVTSLYNYNLS